MQIAGCTLRLLASAWMGDLEEQETCWHLPSTHADVGRREAERGGIFSK